jgi:5-methylthioadenosine/S-adenosylhomocysteine deaminase
MNTDKHRYGKNLEIPISEYDNRTVGLHHGEKNTDSEFGIPSFEFRFSLLLTLFICGVVLLFAGCGRDDGRERVDTIVAGGTVITMDADRRIFEDGAVAIRGDAIVAVGPRDRVETAYRAARTIEARGRLVLPGFVNGHTHAPMTLFRGLADDVALQEWLEQSIFPAEARNVTPDFVLWGTRLALLEMLRSGVTTYADMYYFEETIARETRAAGMRGVLGETILDFPVPSYKTVDEGLALTEEFLKRWQGDPLVRAAVAPHAIYTASDATLQRAFALARRYGAPILIHLAETRREAEEARRQHGVSPVGHLERLGLLGPDVIAAHCVWVDTADVATLARQDVGCVHNPSSNMKLASGTAPVLEMIAAGVAVGLGTDGPAGSNNDLNLMEEMDLAAKLQKVTRMDPSALTAGQALAMATIEGARALGMEQEIGSLEPGKKADLILLRTDRPHAVPMFDAVSHVVYALKAGDVETVLVGGRTLMDQRRVLTLNEPEILNRARQYGEQVRRSLASPNE